MLLAYRDDQDAVGVLGVGQVVLSACLSRNLGGGAEPLSVRKFRAAQR